jgi:hypothetical protein
VSDYGLDDRGSIPDRGRGFPSSPCIETGSEAHPVSYPMGTGGPFPGGKARPGRDADHSPPSSAEVKYEYEVYLLSPHVPPWRVAGQLYTIRAFLTIFFSPPLRAHRFCHHHFVHTVSVTTTSCTPSLSPT